MRKLLKFFLLAAFLTLSTASNAMANDAFTKLGRGLTNILTGPGEFLIQFYATSDRYNPLEAFFATLMRGTVFTIVRELAGVYEVVTFPVPFPRYYNPVMQPPTVFESLASQGIPSEP